MTALRRWSKVLASAANYGTQSNGDLWLGNLMSDLVDAALADEGEA